MNKSLKNILVATMVLSITSCYAQIENTKSETIKIYGNCGMCENTIEKAGSLKNVAKVDWDKDTKLAAIKYDSASTTLVEILKRIALAGYDSDTFYAPADTYAALPGCCQYERAKQTVTTTDAAVAMKHNDMLNEDKIVVSDIEETKTVKEVKPIKEANELHTVYTSYFALKDALVSTDGNKASASAKVLVAAIGQVKMDKLPMDVHMVWMKVYKDLLADAHKIDATKDAAKQRESFMSLSDKMYELMKLSKVESPIYYQHCPMANGGKGANWLSKDAEIKNPYFGNQMLGCGKTVETIK